jgi:hypothetical protein
VRRKGSKREGRMYDVRLELWVLLGICLLDFMLLILAWTALELVWEWSWERIGGI